VSFQREGQCTELSSPCVSLVPVPIPVPILIILELRHCCGVMKRGWGEILAGKREKEVDGRWKCIESSSLSLHLLHPHRSCCHVISCHITLVTLPIGVLPLLCCIGMDGIFQWSTVGKREKQKEKEMREIKKERRANAPHSHCHFFWSSPCSIVTLSCRHLILSSPLRHHV
jgi:hypothetical protein